MKKSRIYALAALAVAVALTFIGLLVGSVHSNAASTTATSVIAPAAKVSSSTLPRPTPTSVIHALPLPPRHHYTVLVIGDSLGTDLAGGLGYQLETSHRVTLVQKGKSETGLSNGWFYNWPRHLRAFLKQYHPQLLIVFLGGNDEQGMNVHGRAAAFATPAWRTQYATNVATMMHEATRAGSAVLWVGMPIMSPNGYRQGMQVVNGIFAAQAAKMPRVTFLPTWNLMANAQGQFKFSAWVNGKYQPVRASDGIHLTAVGQNVIATYVVKEMRHLYRLPVAPHFPMQFVR